MCAFGHGDACRETKAYHGCASKAMFVLGLPASHPFCFCLVKTNHAELTLDYWCLASKSVWPLLPLIARTGTAFVIVRLKGQLQTQFLYQRFTRLGFVDSTNIGLSSFL